MLPFSPPLVACSPLLDLWDQHPQGRLGTDLDDTSITSIHQSPPCHITNATPGHRRATMLLALRGCQILFYSVVRFHKYFKEMWNPMTDPFVGIEMVDVGIVVASAKLHTEFTYDF